MLCLSWQTRFQHADNSKVNFLPARRLPDESGGRPNLQMRASGNARKTMKCGRQSVLILTRDRNADIYLLFPDGSAAMISVND